MYATFHFIYLCIYLFVKAPRVVGNVFNDCPPPLIRPPLRPNPSLAAGADVNAEGTYDVVRGTPLWWAAVAVRNGEDDGGVALAETLLDGVETV